MVNEKSMRGWWGGVVARLRRASDGEIGEDTLRSVPAWGFSLLVHGLLLLVLGLMIELGRNARQDQVIQPATLETEIGDAGSALDTLAPGDPMIEANSSESPLAAMVEIEDLASLAMQPPSLARMSYDLSTAPPTLGIGQRDLARTVVGRPKPAGPDQAGSAVGTGSSSFSGRTAEKRARLTLRGGGTPRSEDAVERGIAWLARHQREDGAWSFQYSGQCEGDGCGGDAGNPSDTAATGLALLPILGHGHTHMEKSRYQDCVRRGIEWLVDHQQENGDLFTGPPGNAYMYSHAIGTMALCEAYGMTQDPRLEAPARMAVQFIISAQSHETGGWRYVPGQQGDTSVFGWQIFAFRSAVLAGIVVPKEVLEGAAKYLFSVGDKDGARYTYEPRVRAASAVMTAEALACRQILGWRREHPSLVKGASLVAADLDRTAASQRNVYYWYYATQLLKNMRNANWKIWNVMVRDELIRTQMTGRGCGHGSWDPRVPMSDRWGASAGRLYQTALSLLILEVYYRYPPTDGLEEPALSPGVEENAKVGKAADAGR